MRLSSSHMPTRQEFYRQLKGIGIDSRPKAAYRNDFGVNSDPWSDYSRAKSTLIEPIPLSCDDYSTMVAWLCDWLQV